MQKLIKNEWHRQSGDAFAIAQILCHEESPEGLDVDRIRFIEAGSFKLKTTVGHIISVLKGCGRLFLSREQKTYQIKAGIHLYLPPGMENVLEAEPEAEFLRVSSASTSQTRGKKFLLRNERFIAACASGSQSLRWVLTPQYLSRRIFLHHDPIILSKSGHPVSWFHTTMFDVRGLPVNEEGEQVFKMSYNSKTEFNVCYDVKGTARVRMANHPYKNTRQLWDQWLPLDSDSTYHLNEAAGGPEEECLTDTATNTSQTLRNKHEVYIVNGHVSLFCLFDPAPTGVERHRPGEYSDYEPLSQVLGTKPYENFAREISMYDEMVDELSLAEAMGRLNLLQGTSIWDLYLRGRDAMAAIETEILKALAAEGNGREKILKHWTQFATDQKE